MGLTIGEYLFGSIIFISAISLVILGIAEILYDHHKERKRKKLKGKQAKMRLEKALKEFYMEEHNYFEL